MAEKGFPIHLIRTAQSMYQNTAIIIRKDRINGNTSIEINKGVRQGCPLALILFNIYIDKVIKDWLQVIKQYMSAKELILNTVFFADDQVTVTSTEDELKIAVYTLNNLAMKYNLKISVNKTKAMATKEKMNVRTKIVMSNNIIKKVNSFNYLEYTITASNNSDLEIKMNRFHQMCSTIRRTLNNKTRDIDNFL
jgi:hypothetical protein